MQTRTLAEKTADRLMALIREEGYGAGDRLPTEKDLCAQLGVGRNTLREALKLLASRNVVTIRQGAGTYVAENPGVVDDPLGFSLVADRRKLTQDLLQIRLILEPGIAALAAQCATQADIGELEEVLLALEGAVCRQESFWELDVAYHRKIAECTHNSVMENLIPIISGGVHVFSGEVSSQEYHQTQETHRRIFEAIRRHSAFDAEMEMRYHLLYNQKRYQSEIQNSSHE